MNGFATLVVMLLFLTPTGLVAQDRWALEVREGAAAAQEFGDTKLDTGFGFEATLRYQLTRRLATYAGWDVHRFGSAQASSGTHFDFQEMGYAGGVFLRPFAKDGGTPALELRAGLTTNSIKISDSGEVLADSNHGLGWETGAVVVLPISDALLVTPGFRYRSMSRDVTVRGTDTAVELSYFALELGFAVTF